MTPFSTGSPEAEDVSFFFSSGAFPAGALVHYIELELGLRPALSGIGKYQILVAYTKQCRSSALQKVLKTAI